MMFLQGHAIHNTKKKHNSQDLINQQGRDCNHNIASFSQQSPRFFGYRRFFLHVFYGCEQDNDIERTSFKWQIFLKLCGKKAMTRSILCFLTQRIQPSAGSDLFAQEFQKFTLMTANIQHPAPFRNPARRHPHPPLLNKIISDSHLSSIVQLIQNSVTNCNRQQAAVTETDQIYLTSDNGQTSAGIGSRVPSAMV